MAKKITLKKLTELSEVKLGMDKQYYVTTSDIVKELPMSEKIKKPIDDIEFYIKTISDIQTTFFDKKVYLCEFSLFNLKGWINMEVSEFNQLETI
jgi:hypothetical protein